MLQNTIDACDYVLRNVSPYESFEITKALENFKPLKEKEDFFKIDYLLHDADMRNGGRDVIAFMLNEGYIELYKDYTDKYILTDSGRIAKIIDGHNKYQKYLKRQQWALVRYPAFLYLTRWVAFIISGIALIVSLSIGIYTVYKSNSSDDKYKDIKKQSQQFQSEVQQLRKSVKPIREHQALDTIQVGKANQ